MDPEALTARHRRGSRRRRVPVMIVATAGTTGGGMIDPLQACADIAQAGRPLVPRRCRLGRRGAGIGSTAPGCSPASSAPTRSPSTPTNGWPRPWAAPCSSRATDISCPKPSMPRPASCRRASPGVDPYLNSVQWSRRFLGLRLFLALASAGWEGLGAHVERSVAVVDTIKERLLGAGLDGRERFRAGGARCGAAGRTRGCARAGAPGGGLGPGLGRAHRPSRAAMWCASAPPTAKPPSRMSMPWSRRSTSGQTAP